MARINNSKLRKTCLWGRSPLGAEPILEPICVDLG
jgi:hypothetical protein